MYIGHAYSKFFTCAFVSAATSLMMKTVIIFTALTLSWVICPIVAFLPNTLVELGLRSVSLSSDSAVTHEDMTRDAILDVAAKVLRDNPNPDNEGSSGRISDLSSLDEESLITAYYGQSWLTSEFENAIGAIQDANNEVDFGKERTLAAAHFDSEQFQSGQERLIALRQNVVSSILAKNFDVARRDTGSILHALQDFYSHSNWIENGNTSPNRQLGKPNQRLDNVASPTRQTCIKCEEKGFWFTKYYNCHGNIESSLQRDGILTSGYYSGLKDTNGQEIQKPLGKCSHGGFADSTRDTYAEGGINKDSPYYRSSPHYYLHYEAAAVAQQATVDILQDIRGEVNNDLLFGAYLGVMTTPYQAADTAESVNDIKLSGIQSRLSRMRANLLQSVNYIRGRGRNTGNENMETLLARIADLELVVDADDGRTRSRGKRQSDVLNIHLSSGTTKPPLESTENMISSALSASSLMPMQLILMLIMALLLLISILY